MVDGQLFRDYWGLGSGGEGSRFGELGGRGKGDQEEIEKL